MTELTLLVLFAGIPGRCWVVPPLSLDKYDPDTLERLIQYLESSPNASTTLSASVTISDTDVFCSGVCKD